jgi:cytidylate kinase
VAVITFSREPHSGTQDLARVLAERLGYRYVGIDELTRAVTERSGVERAPHTSENEGRALSLWEQLGEHLTGDREAYTTALRAVTTDLAAADNVVIVGHGAGLFLSDLRTAVRVFVVAPIEDRVARLIAAGVETDPELARRLIEQRDHDSAEYIRQAFGIDWLDPHQWDLVINTGRADARAAVDMLVYYAQSLIRDRAERDDLGRQQLTNRIEQALLADDDLGIDKVRVRFDLDAASIVLEGEALSEADREHADLTARRLAPQATIDNQIVVRPPTTA